MAQAITSISSVSTVLQDECHSPSRLSPVILGLQELELLLDPVAGLSYSKLEWLARLVGDLNPDATACEEKEQEELSHQSSGSRHSHTDGNVAYKRSLSLAFFFFFGFTQSCHTSTPAQSQSHAHSCGHLTMSAIVCARAQWHGNLI